MPDPTSEEYLGIVSEWSSYAKDSPTKVGNVYPVYAISSDRIVEKPIEEFPNPGYIFLVNRGELNTWDFLRLRPLINARYTNRKERECYYIAPRATSQLLEEPSPDAPFAMLIDVPAFDPVQSSSIIRNPHQGVTPVFFVRNVQGRIFGPLRRAQVTRTAYETIESVHWAPIGKESLVYEFTIDDLKRRGIKMLTYEHPNPDLNEVIQKPIHLLIGPVHNAFSDKSYDRLSEAQLAEWYLRWRDQMEVPEAVLKSLRTAADYLTDTSADTIRQRCRKLLTLVSTLDILQTERRMLARRYLESEEGQKLLQQQIALEAERRAQELDAEVKRRRSELASEQQKLAEKLDAIRAEHKEKVEEINDSVRVLEARKTELQEGLTSLEGQLRSGAQQLATKLRDELPLLAVLSGGAHTVTVNGPVSTPTSVPSPAPQTAGKPTWAEVTIPTPTKDLADVRDESALVEQVTAELTAEQLCFTRDFLANLYVTLKSSALNLIMGPPGHGKSSVVAAMGRALGHGNALLEIAVRRSWSDDRYLLGFYDTFHGRYDPGPTGLATRLLQAQRDWERDRNGLYLVLLDEFNLAAPEYYFSQLLQILTRPVEQRVLHLFDPASLPAGATDRIHQVLLNPNVSFWGTINYDETTERLSPRLLDRTGMIFLTARDVLPSLTPAEARARGQGKGIKAGQLIKAFVKSAAQCPEDLWDRIQPLLDPLKQQTEEWGAGIDLSPRVIDGIKRYLANSVHVLTPARAVDFVFQQRVLPALRGRGPKYAARIRALADKLGEQGLERCARHVRDALALAEMHFGDIDFLAY